MSEVKRYNSYAEGPIVHFEADSEGAWVDAIDYDVALSQLAALREELAACNLEKNDVAYRANETAEKLNSMMVSKATMRNQLKQKLASTQQRLADAERRNGELTDLLREMRRLPQKRCAAFIVEIIDLLDSPRAALTKPEEAKS